MNEHTGPAHIATYRGGYMLLCPVGHVVDSVRTGEDYGYALLARDGETVTCRGAMPAGGAS